MGERGHSTHSHQHNPEETITSLGVGGYTTDWFVCGLCGAKTSDIECYVSHMMMTEHCVLHLCPSAAITDLLLPRFSKKQKRMEGEDVDIKNTKDLVGIIDKGSGEGGDADVKVVVPASEVETGGERRWKCRLCGLTFSRQAAVHNHFKLQHTEGGTAEEEKVLPPQDTHIKRESPTDPHAPVKHILVVESKLEARDTTTAPDKMWNKLACHVCGQLFKTSKILRSHVSTVHSAGRPFSCSYHGCLHAFKTKGSLKRHQRRHTGERPFACPDCGRSFRESGSLARHQRARGLCSNKTDAQMPRYGTSLPLSSHMPAERKPTFSDHKPAIQLKQELLGPHTDDTTRDWTVEESKAGLKGVAETQTVKTEPLHLQPPHPPPSSSSTQLVPCKLEAPPAPPSPLMGEEEDPDDALEPPDMNPDEDIKPPHQHLLPDILRKSFTCPLCCQSYTRRSTLAFHMKFHLEQLGEHCGECDKTFSSRAALSRHLSSHSSLRQFECRLCHKSFKLLSHARAHLAIHTHTRSIPCQHCGRIYKSRSARNMHERTHTDTSTFSCMQCHKTFATKASLVRHLRTHTGEAPFSCRYCGRGFKEHGTLSRHLKHKMPCARQAAMEVETGDVGIRLLPGTMGRLVKEEEGEEGMEKEEALVHSSPPSAMEEEAKSSWTLQYSPAPSSFVDPEELPSASPTSNLFQALGEEGPGAVALVAGEHGSVAVIQEDQSYILVTGRDHTSLQALSALPLLSEG